MLKPAHPCFMYRMCRHAHQKDAIYRSTTRSFMSVPYLPRQSFTMKIATTLRLPPWGRVFVDRATG